MRLNSEARQPEFEPTPMECSPQRPSFLQRIKESIGRLNLRQPFSYLTTVHPCFIKGQRTLVYRRGFVETEPRAYGALARWAKKHGFQLLQDRRAQALSCRDERRRMAPLLFFAAGLASNVAIAAEAQSGFDDIPTIEVIAHKPTNPDDRAYLKSAGKRFVSEPQGEIELILAVAEKVRAGGEKKRISTRGMQMPAEYVGSFIDRYDYTMPANCGGHRFSFYEGDGFVALGFHEAENKVVLDVIAGGGPFTGPRLWGAYDQVLNSNTKMELMFGNGAEDGMGLLKASYKIGLMPSMSSRAKRYYGGQYVQGIEQASGCNVVPLPEVRHADVTPSATEEII